MAIIKRRSPVSFNARPVKTENRGDWTVVLEYDQEGEGPHLVDLSHRTRWDIQSPDISQMKPLGASVPEKPGACHLENGVLINRMNRTQASLWHLSGDTPEMPADEAFTETTDVTLFFALLGEKVFSITEKLTSLDLSDPAKTAPFLIQGPFSHVPCQIVVMDNAPGHCGILLTCSRGYGRDMTTAILESGEAFGLRPAGEGAFHRWLQGLKG